MLAAHVRKLIASIAIALAGATAAVAQPVPADIRYEEYVEARRPVIERRALTGEEQATVKRMAAQIKKAKDWGEVDIQSLDQLIPMGNAGDKPAMRALMDGYSKSRGSSLKHAVMASKSLEGLWAMTLWKEGVRDRVIANSIMDCLQYQQFGAMYGNLPGIGCGFSAYVAGKAGEHLESYVKGKTKAPERIDFTEAPLVDSIEKEKARFEKVLAAYSAGDDVKPEDYGWAASWSQKLGKEWAERWSRAGSDRYRTLDNRASVAKVDAEAEQQRLIAEWTALAAKQKQAVAEGGKLSQADQASWDSVSFKLGGKYLEPYASENYLGGEVQIDAYCRKNPGVVCDRQKRIWQALADSAHNERLARELALRNLTLGGDTVSTRAYDQNGNYLGSSTMPAWQADILKGN